MNPQRLLLLLIASTISTASATPPLTVTQEADGVTVRVGYEVFARYVTRSGTRPVLWPVNGPGGVPMTRSYPVGPIQPSEEDDHVHHRSMWIGYEGVNGVDFWHEPETIRTRHYPIGTVDHRGFVRADSTGEVATVGARNDWLSPDGRVVAHDQRLIEFRAGDDWRAIDFVLDLWSSDGPLVLGDTKEGFFALRVPGTMKVDAGLGGRLLNSRGEADEAAWGRPAAWVDYTGPTEGATLGIAILSHPSNIRAEPRWHARTYGLLAANPFGVEPYGGDAQEESAGLRLPEGERLRLRYRVWIHAGEASPERLAAEFDDYRQIEFED